ncbi:hypothetical protein ANO14919_098150 [Xylariales sp. No.14919]|nr:hypothetical protein ANO14919_098150 [Xylariales sp. No.14919]
MAISVPDDHLPRRLLGGIEAKAAPTMGKKAWAFPAAGGWVEKKSEGLHRCADTRWQLS